MKLLSKIEKNIVKATVHCMTLRELVRHEAMMKTRVQENTLDMQAREYLLAISAEMTRLAAMDPVLTPRR